MKKATGRVICAFVVGQVVQIILALLAKVSYMDRPILFCIAAGFLILVAVGAGMRLVMLEAKEKAAKTYQDYAEPEGYK